MVSLEPCLDMVYLISFQVLNENLTNFLTIWDITISSYENGFALAI